MKNGSKKGLAMRGKMQSLKGRMRSMLKEKATDEEHGEMPMRKKMEMMKGRSCSMK